MVIATLQAISRLVEYLLSALLCTIVVLLLSEVFFRYLLGHSLLWVEELSRFLFQWIVFVGSAVALGRGSHFTMRIAVDSAPRVVRTAAVFVLVAAAFTFSMVLIYQGWELAQLAAPQTSSVLRISRFWFYLAIPAGGVLMLLYLPAMTLYAWRSRDGIAPIGVHP